MSILNFRPQMKSDELKMLVLLILRLTVVEISPQTSEQTTDHLGFNRLANQGTHRILALPSVTKTL